MATLLTYHHVAARPAGADKASLYVSPDAFARQLDTLLAAGFQVISLDQLSEGFERVDLPSRAVAITFDDGFRDNYEAAFPLLRRRGLTAAFFVTTGWIGRESPEAGDFMSEDDLRELAEAGMTIGSHGVSHRRLARLPLDEARRELIDSKARLEAILGRPVRWLAYPSGSFSPEIARLAREAGYAGACSVIRDNRIRRGQRYYLPRVMVMNTTSAWRFRYYFSPLYHFVHAAKNRRRWRRYV